MFLASKLTKLWLFLVQNSNGQGGLSFLAKPSKFSKFTQLLKMLKWCYWDFLTSLLVSNFQIFPVTLPSRAPEVRVQWYVYRKICTTTTKQNMENANFQLWWPTMIIHSHKCKSCKPIFCCCLRNSCDIHKIVFMILNKGQSALVQMDMKCLNQIYIL